MNWGNIRVLFVHEMRMLLRDRRTVVLAVVLPLITMPLILFATKYMSERRAKRLEEIVYRYAVAGSEAKYARDLIARGRVRIAELSRLSEGSTEDVKDFRCVETTAADPSASLKSREIHFYVQALSGTEAEAQPKTKQDVEDRSPRPRRPPQGRVLAEPIRLPGVPVIRIYFLANEDASRAGQSKMRQLLQHARSAGRDAMLQAKGFSLDPAQVIPVTSSTLAGASQVTGSYVGRYLTLFFLMFMLTGGSVVAMDIVAGEKERGSLETLLTTALKRGEIVAAKQIAILAVALFITLVQAANFLVYITLKAIPLPKDFVIEVPPAAIAALLLLFIPVAALVAAVLLMLSAYAKSYKEAQLYFFPVYLVSLVPPLAAVLPGVSLRSAVVLVPLANVSVAAREIMVGKYDWPMIFLAFLVMAAVAAGTVHASARMLTQERLITASETDVADLAGGPELFPRHVLRWYAVLGVILFSVAANIPQLATFRRQLLFNELALFLAAPLVMIWRYRLSVREALALRPVKPVIWLAVLLLVPSGNLVGLAVFRLANLVLPVPRHALEQFGRDVLPSDVPAWQLFFFISLLPGICEEIGFRGTLLYGLRHRFRPAVLALVVGLVFGLFHVALFRIIPTGFLGIVLTAVALLTGSIFPGMVMHAGNNALALWAARQGFPLADLNWKLYLAAACTFALSFYVIYRNRTPYPGLRGRP